MSQIRDAATKRQRILDLLGDGRPRTTPGALYLLRGLEAAGRLRADRTGRHWAWSLPFSAVEGMP